MKQQTSIEDIEKQAEILFEDIKKIIKYANKCRSIQYQILDYCVKLAADIAPVDKEEVITDLRNFVIWEEE